MPHFCLEVEQVKPRKITTYNAYVTAYGRASQDGPAISRRLGGLQKRRKGRGNIPGPFGWCARQGAFTWR
jgi:hypothetical protein